MNEEKESKENEAEQNDGGMDENEKLKRAFLKETEQFYETMKKKYGSNDVCKGVLKEAGIDIIK